MIVVAVAYIVYDNFYFEQNLHYIECLDYSYKFILSWGMIIFSL